MTPQHAPVTDRNRSDLYRFPGRGHVPPRPPIPVRPRRTHRWWTRVAIVFAVLVLGGTAVARLSALGPATLSRLAGPQWARWADLIAGSTDTAQLRSLARVVAAVVNINTTYARQHVVGAGTGIVLASEGVVLTNNHVVEGATAITATDVGNRHRYPVAVLGRDRTHDVALVALDGATGLFTAPIGASSAVAVGDRVVAIGNADGRGGRPPRAAGTVAGLDQTVSAADDLTRRP